jgi:hypothetical protein
VSGVVLFRRARERIAYGQPIITANAWANWSKLVNNDTDD